MLNNPDQRRTFTEGRSGEDLDREKDGASGAIGAGSRGRVLKECDGALRRAELCTDSWNYYQTGG